MEKCSISNQNNERFFLTETKKLKENIDKYVFNSSFKKFVSHCTNSNEKIDKNQPGKISIKIHGSKNQK